MGGLKLDPTDEEFEAAWDDENLPVDCSRGELRALWRYLAPIIARKRRDATVAWLKKAATWGNGVEAYAFESAADAIERDEDLEP